MWAWTYACGESYDASTSLLLSLQIDAHRCAVKCSQGNGSCRKQMWVVVETVRQNLWDQTIRAYAQRMNRWRLISLNQVQDPLVFAPVHMIGRWAIGSGPFSLEKPCSDAWGFFDREFFHSDREHRHQVCPTPQGGRWNNDDLRMHHSFRTRTHLLIPPHTEFAGGHGGLRRIYDLALSLGTLLIHSFRHLLVLSKVTH